MTLTTDAPAGRTRSADFATMVARLNKLSVEKHHDAYEDVAWDDPDLALDPTDPRLELPDGDPLAEDAAYRALPPEERARIGLYRYAACMKIGWHFENLLQRGLLARAMHLPNGDVEFRYLHHELIEESQHTLMFQEFVNRSGLPVRGMPRTWRLLGELVVPTLARRLPATFFLLVLGGEDPVDHLQRMLLRNGLRHPLVERIMRIHVTEEARHLSFARHDLGRIVDDLPWFRRAFLAVAAPVVLAVMARMMLLPPADLVRNTALDRATVRRAFRTPGGRRLLADSVGKTRKLWGELGLRPRWAAWLWPALGIG